MDDGKPQLELESDDWELLHPNDDHPIVVTGPTLDSIRPDHFSIVAHNNPNSSSSSSSNSSSELDRNFDDSYVVNQLFPNPTLSLAPWTGDSDSDTTNTNTNTTVVMAEVEEDNREEMEQVKEEQHEEGEKRIVWWKVPLEVLRYWVNPIPIPIPVWSLSVAAAAAFLGLYFLGRRLYRIKRKTQTFNLNLALDDKKVSQLMGRVARLNEAFSVVRRVPIVRSPSLPASSVSLRPVMSMR